MAEVCQSLDSGNTTRITTGPLNLSLLEKKRGIDSILQNEEMKEDAVKRQRQSDQDENKKDINDGIKPEITEQNEEDEKSRSSILQHFYSFIQRKASEEGLDERTRNKPDEQEEKKANNKENVSGEDRGPTPHINDNYKTSPQDRSSPPLSIKNGHNEFDYNSAISRHLAARANTAKFMDIWSVMTANALARAKSNGFDISRKSPDYPSMISMGGGYDLKPTPPSPYTTMSPGLNNPIPERTMRQNNWAVKVWRDWAIERNSHSNMTGKTGPTEIVPMDIKEATIEGMSYWLPIFITEVRRRDKRPYPPDTLMQIASGLQRHLRHVSGRSDITFFDKYSPTFADFREALKARSDAITSELSTNRRGSDQDASPESNDGGSDQWASTLFNLNTAKGLFRAIFYYNCLTFHITSMEEHHSLLVSQFLVGYDEKTQQEYLEFTRDNGQTSRKFATPFDPRCIVKVFKKYFQHIPSTGLLYKRPLQSTDSSELRFSFNPVGINKLRETFKILFGGRRTGASYSHTADDEEEREGLSAVALRFHSGEEERRIIKFNHSPESSVGSDRTSSLDLQRRYEEENRRPSETDASDCFSPTRSVSNYATESADKSLKQENVILASRAENNNNNASLINEDDSLTLTVPMYVKSITVHRGNKRMRIDLTE